MFKIDEYIKRISISSDISLKVGDIVKIKPYKKIINRIGFVKEMKIYCNNIYTIEAISNNAMGSVSRFVEIPYYWNIKWLEKQG